MSPNVREFPFNTTLLDREPQSLTFRSFGITVRSLSPVKAWLLSTGLNLLWHSGVSSTLTFVQHCGITPRRVFQQFQLTPPFSFPSGELNLRADLMRVKGDRPVWYRPNSACSACSICEMRSVWTPTGAPPLIRGSSLGLLVLAAGALGWFAFVCFGGLKSLFFCNPGQKGLIVCLQHFVVLHFRWETACCCALFFTCTFTH